MLHSIVNLVEQSRAVLKRVQKLVAEGNTDVSPTDKAGVTESEYIDGLEILCTGNIVVLQHEPHECFINNYNPSVMLAWQANIDTVCAKCICLCHVCGLMYHESYGRAT